MEQTVQKQTSGCHRYSTRRMPGTLGQSHSIILCSGHKEKPPHDVFGADCVASLVALQQEYKAQIQLFYHIPASLSHYGKVDSLVTAGAMADFVDYVYSLEHEEAQKFFAPLKDVLPQHVQNVIIVREAVEWKKILQSHQNDFAEILHFCHDDAI